MQDPVRTTCWCSNKAAIPNFILPLLPVHLLIKLFAKATAPIASVPYPSAPASFDQFCVTVAPPMITFHFWAKPMAVQDLDDMLLSRHRRSQ